MNFDHWFVRTAAYLAFGLFVFVATLLLTFPDGRITQIAAVQIESQLEKRFQQNYDVTVDDFDLWWLWGGELEGVTIERQAVAPGSDSGSDESGSNQETTQKTKAGNAADKQAPKSNNAGSGESGSRQQPLSITIDSVAARLAPISSLTNQALAVRYSLGVGNGTIGGTVVRGSDALSVTASISGVRLNKIEFLEQYTGVPMFGDFSGDISLDFLPNSAVVRSGDIAIDGEQIQFGPKPGLKLDAIPIDPDVPSTNLGNLTIRLNIESKQPGQPVVRVDTFDATGRDIERLQVWGRAELASRLSRTKLRLMMRTKFRSEFISKNNLGPILQIKQFRNGSRGDWYGFIVVGYIQNLTFKGASAATSGPSKSKNGGTKPIEPNNDTPNQPRKLKRK
jgi:type II secretion system protein N